MSPRTRILVLLVACWLSIAPEAAQCVELLVPMRAGGEEEGGAPRTNTFTPASPQELFRSPASTNYFGRLIGQGGGSSCSKNAGCGFPSLSCEAAGRLACMHGGTPPRACTEGSEPETIQLLTGGFAHGMTDAYWQGTGPGVRLCRIYRSDVDYEGPMGKNWEFCQNARLLEVPNLGTVTWISMGREDAFNQGNAGYTNPAGWYGTLSKDSGNNRFYYTLPDGTEWRFDDDDGGGFYRLYHYKDRYGNDVTHHYDGSSRLTRIDDTLERSTYFYYDSTNTLLTQVQDWNSRLITYSYGMNSSVARLTKVTYWDGSYLAYQYDSSNRLTGIVDPGESDPVAKVYYDGSSKVTRVQQGPSGHDILASYDTGNRNVTVTDRVGYKTIYRYDTSDLLTKIEGHDAAIDGTYSSWSFSYDAQGEITRQVLPRGNEIRTTYNAYGNPTLVEVRPDAGTAGLTTSYGYGGTYQQMTSMTQPGGQVWTYEYDSSGNLTKSKTPSLGGSTLDTTYAYNARGQQTSMTSPGGIVTAYEYTTTNAISSYLTKVVMDSGASKLNLSKLYGRDTYGNETSMADQDGKTTTYAYDLLQRVTKITNPAGHETKYGYDAKHNLTKVQVAKDAAMSNSWFETDYLYDFEHRVTRQIVDEDATNRLTTDYAYDKNGRLTKETLASRNPATNPRTVEHEYDEFDRVTKTIRDAAGLNIQETTSYDLSGNAISRKDGENRGTVSEYDLYDRLTKVKTLTLDFYTTSAYDTNSRLTKSTHYSSGASELAYEETVFDAAGRSTSSRRKAKKADGSSNLESGGDGLQTTTYAYDADSRVTTVTDDKGNATTTVYDNAGRRVTVKDALAGADQNQVIYAYNNRGLVTQQTSVEESQVTAVESDRSIDTYFAYDDLGRMTKREDESLNDTLYAYDVQGRVTRVTDPLGKKVETSYDELGRTLTEVQIAVDDGGGNVLSNDIVREYVYDAYGRVDRIKDWNWRGGTQYNQESVFTYDKADRATTKSYPLGGGNTLYIYAYDKAGNVTSETDPNGSVIAQTYDAANRMLSKVITRASGVIGVTKEEFTYDHLGRIVTAQNWDGDSSWSSRVIRSYNSLSLIESEQMKIENVSKTTSYEYDDLGRRTTMNHPDGSTLVKYEYDALSRVNKISRDGVQVVRYYYAGPHRTVSKHREGSRSEYSYDSHGRLLTIDHAKSSNGSKLARFFYKYDDSDDIVYKDTYYYDGAGTQWVSADDKGDWYVYDGAHRLVTTYAGVNNGLTAAPTGGQYVAKWGYVYDNLGNRLTKDDQVGSADVVYAYDANTNNCLTAVTLQPEVADFDNNGSTLTLYDGALMAYDYTNKLANAINADGTDRAVHRYDAFGRRVAKDVYATGTGWELTDVLHYYHDGIDIVGRLHVVENGDAYLDPIWDRRYTYGPGIDEPLEYRRGSAGTERYYYHEDFLGSIAVLTDSTGALQEGYRYSDWGEVTGYSSARALIDVATGGKQNPWTFTGRESQDESGSPGVNFRARVHSPAIGRFAQVDPWLAGGGYAWPLGNPVAFRDPLGLFAVSPSQRVRPDFQALCACLLLRDEVRFSGALATSNALRAEVTNEIRNHGRCSSQFLCRSAARKCTTQLSVRISPRDPSQALIVGTLIRGDVENRCGDRSEVMILNLPFSTSYQPGQFTFIDLTPNIGIPCGCTTEFRYYIWNIVYGADAYRDPRNWPGDSHVRLHEIRIRWTCHDCLDVWTRTPF